MLREVASAIELVQPPDSDFVAPARSPAYLKLQKLLPELSPCPRLHERDARAYISKPTTRYGAPRIRPLRGVKPS